MEDQQLVEDSIKKITKGAGLIFTGLIFTTLVGFLTKFIIIRNTSVTEYGIFVLAITVLTISATIFGAGLQLGVTRYISFFRGKKDFGRVKGTIISSLQISGILAIIGTVTLFFASGFLAAFFNEPGLELPIKILAFVLPLILFIPIFISTFQGFDLTRPKVIFRDILFNSLNIILIAAVFLVGLEFIYIFYAYLSARFIVFLVTASYFKFYFRKKFQIYTKKIKTVLLRKELLFFSAPLLILTTLSLVMNWTDTVMLGYFKSSALVGLYNGAVPLAQFLPVFLSAFGFLYFPICSRLIAQRKFKDLKRIYTSITKWILALSLPAFLIFFLFPDIVLNFLFGPAYTEAAWALRILSVGFLVYLMVGHTAPSLIAMGKTKLISILQAVVVVINIFLNFLLIPVYGLIGAAIASSTSIILASALMAIFLYKGTKIHAFTINYIKPLIFSILSISGIYFFAHQFLKIKWWMLPLFFIVFLIVYGLIILVTRSFDKEDVAMLLRIEKKFGLNLRQTKKLIKRFI